MAQILNCAELQKVLHLPDCDGRRGLYLAIDGPDGIGKSTLVTFAAKALKRSGREVIVRSEPERNGPLWRTIRDHRLSGKYSDEVWLLILIAASLASQSRHNTTPDPRSVGVWILTDRSPMAAFAHYWQSVDTCLRDALISRFVPPDALIWLRPKGPDLLRRRLHERREAEEHVYETLAEGRNYDDVAVWLKRRGWPIITVDATESATTEALWHEVLKRVSSLPLRKLA